MALNLREVEIFRPYNNEFPEQLLLDAGVSEDDLHYWSDAEMLRVAKLGEQMLAVYSMDRQGTDYLLHGIVVDPRYRKQGLGRWFAGHAIGVAESKGGRLVWLTQSGGSRCFLRMGFERAESFVPTTGAQLPNSAYPFIVQVAGEKHRPKFCFELKPE